MQAQGLSERTVTDWPIIVARVAKLSDVSPATMQTGHIVAYLARPLAAQTRRSYHTALHAWFVYLIRNGHRLDDPTVLIPRQRLPRKETRTISTAHVRRLLDSGIRARTRSMVILGAYAGMRASEIAAMAGRHVDVVRGEIVIAGKGGVTRHVPLHPNIAAEAEHYGPGIWFPSRTHRAAHMMGKSVSTTICEAMGRAGIPGTTHDLRRWFATSLVDGGTPLTTVQHLLGHASLATTQRYVAVDRQQEHAAVLALPLVA